MNFNKFIPIRFLTKYFNLHRLRISHADIIFQGKEFHVHLYVIFFFSKGVPAHKASSIVPLLLHNSKFDLNPNNESSIVPLLLHDSKFDLNPDNESRSPIMKCAVMNPKKYYPGSS